MTVPVVGVDLAWSDGNRTGVVVVADGRVVVSATVVTDDEIAALVPERGPVVLAVDAPVVVPNETGRRHCDAEVSRCFGRFHAGAYPANRSIPWLAEPRAARLAARLRCDVDPTAARTVVEVHPHGASVTLFGLDRILPYKARSGRDLASRRAALDALLDHLEGLRDARHGIDVTTGPRWGHLRGAVRDAPTMAALGRVEDEVDGHLCAQVGHLLAVAPDEVDVVGDPTTGAIVVPCSPRTSPCLAAA